MLIVVVEQIESAPFQIFTKVQINKIKVAVHDFNIKTNGICHLHDTEVYLMFVQ